MDDLPVDPMARDRDNPDSEHVELCGPFEETYVLLNGFKVPRLTGYSRDGGIVTLVVDHRFGYDFPVAVYEQVVCAIAHSVAIERGYSHFPNGKQDATPAAPPFGGQMHGVALEGSDG